MLNIKKEFFQGDIYPKRCEEYEAYFTYHETLGCILALVKSKKINLRHLKHIHLGKLQSRKNEHKHSKRNEKKNKQQKYDKRFRGNTPKAHMIFSFRDLSNF